MDGRDGNQKDTQDTTRLVEIEEVNRAIRTLLFVTKLSPADTHKDKTVWWGATLKMRLLTWRGKRQEAQVQLSRDRKTELAFLQELIKRLKDRHVDCVETVVKKATANAVSSDTLNPDTPHVLQTMMKLEQVKARAKTAITCEPRFAKRSGRWSK
jgi:hypothetical protein